MQSTINIPQELVNRYRAFYLVKRKQGHQDVSANAATAPIRAAFDSLNKNFREPPDQLIEIIAASVMKLMGRARSLSNHQAIAVLPLSDERKAIIEFSRFFVEEYWVKKCRQRSDMIVGNRQATIIHTCEFLYKCTYS